MYAGRAQTVVGVENLPSTVVRRCSSRILARSIRHVPAIRAEVWAKERDQVAKRGEVTATTALDLFDLAAPAVVSIDIDLKPEPHEKRATA